MIKELINLLLEKSLKVADTSVFELASGKKSNFYIDCRKTTQNARGAYLIGNIIFDRISNLDVYAIKVDVETVSENKPEKKKREKKSNKNPAVSKLTPDAVIQRLKMGYSGITCCIDHFGEEGAGCFTEGNTIFINRNHPLYKREVKNRDTHILNIARLLTQEISLMKDPKNPRQAFERQGRLLKDAFRA